MLEAPADGILPGKIAAGHSFTNDCDPGRVSGIAPVEPSSAQQRYAERLEILLAYEGHRHGRVVRARWFGPALDLEPVGKSHAIGRHRDSDACRGNAGKGADSI